MLTPSCNVIRITDVKEIVICECLRNIYWVDIYELEKHAKDVLKLANRYQIPGLKNICDQYISDNLSESNPAECIQFANSYNANILEQKTNDWVTTTVLEKLKETVNSLTWEQKLVLTQMVFN